MSRTSINLIKCWQNNLSLLAILSLFLVPASAISSITLLESKSSSLMQDGLKISLKEKIISKTDEHIDSKEKEGKAVKVKLATAPRVGPITVKVDINPVNINQNQASVNLDLIEGFDIITHKKAFTYDSSIDIKKLKNYLSLDTVNSLVETIKAELSPVE